ncbi:site-specific integrase [Thermosynechococcaceae cyanobacterium BACA0444]|uniref:Site-specific integrase n=1 Tax=Pseudocalidococcus azoricus BACA0444 TaxID=2918990 RepID=A0AAE4FWB8_9CYAN|nr:site-specific integrase [Pseudocalidococcus azoricus]MDS3862472.1 site-specific integrase [Pseudocalidococcus azoricus BACA0444]
MADTPLNRSIAKRKAGEIECDLHSGHYDPTLAKYKPKPVREALTTVHLFERFIESRQTQVSPQAIESRYRPILSNLKRFKSNIEDESQARAFVDLLRSRQSALIANQNLSLLKTFGAWAVAEEHWSSNHFESIERLKVSHAPKPKRLPFTREETRKLLDAARLHPRWHSYHDFYMVLLYLGVRPSEAIGLRWRHINWQRQTITICESLGRTRQAKSTKNGKARVIDLHPDLLAMFQGRFSNDKPQDALIFTTATGKVIDDHCFSQRTWKDLCKAAGIPHQVPYAARHSLGSHLLENGASIPQVVEILGNNPETTARHYAHAINRPQMPGF